MVETLYLQIYLVDRDTEKNVQNFENELNDKFWVHKRAKLGSLKYYLIFNVV